MTWLKNYKSSLILLGAVALGAIIGVYLPELAGHLKPIGEIFLNLMFVIIVPLVFFSILSAVTSSQDMNRMKKITFSALGIFLFLVCLCAVSAYLGVLMLNPVEGVNIAEVMKSIPKTDPKLASFSDLIVRVFSAPDFYRLFSREQLLPLIVFAFLTGTAVNMSSEKVQPIREFIQGITEVLFTLIKILMYFAPLGLGSYFAYTISVLGSEILAAFLSVVILYLGLTLFYWAILSPAIAFLAKGPAGVSTYWKNILPPTLMAIATSSSAACISINLATAKKMGIQDDVAETVMPLGANVHRNGSTFSAVIKISFLLGLTGHSLVGIENALMIMGVAILVSTLVSAIPGGGMTAEMMICSLFGFPIEMLALIVILATIVDIPATLVNSNGNLIAGMLVDRVVGKSKEEVIEV